MLTMDYNSDNKIPLHLHILQVTNDNKKHKLKIKF